MPPQQTGPTSGRPGIRPQAGQTIIVDDQMQVEQLANGRVKITKDGVTFTGTITRPAPGTDTRVIRGASVRVDGPASG